MRSAKAKNFFREIKNNKGRFLSIFFIVLLGTAFFAGIRSTSGAMKYLADKYYSDSDLMDMRVLSTLGMTDKDIDDLNADDDIEIAEGGHTADVLVQHGQELKVIKVVAETEQTNKADVLEGRMPEAKDECLADVALTKELGYKVGDKLKVRSGTSDDIADTLNTTEFTITGIGNLPYYIDLTRGNSNIGDGEVVGFILVIPDVFEQDFYTEGYIKLKDTKGVNAFVDEYQDTVDGTEDKIEDIMEAGGDRRYDEIVSDAREEIDEHKQEIADGEKELADAKKELDDGEQELKDAKKELEDAEKELADAKKELKDAKKELKDAKKEIEDGKQKIADAEKEIADSEEELGNGWEEYNNGKAELESGREQLGNAWQQYYDGQAELAAQEAKLNEGKAELDAADAELTAKEEAFAQQKAEYEAGEAQYAQGMELLKQDPDNAVLKAKMEALRAQLDAIAPQLAAAEQQLAAARQLIEEKRQELEAGAALLEEAKAQAAEGYNTLAAKQAEFDASEQKLAEAYNELAEGQQKLDDGKKELEEKKKELEDGEKEYEDGLKEYEDGKKEYEDGVKEYEDGKKEYEDSLAEWEDGKKEYDDNYDDAIEEIEDGKQKLADAEKELDDLERPDTYVLDREKVASLVSFSGDADRIDKLAGVFPVIFFLVAALVSLTAMTRMVEAQRLEIGTMKALGASDASIAMKYVLYAAIASIGGGIIGVFIGESIIPFVVCDTYHMLYTGIPVGYYPFNVFWAVIAIIVATGCTVGATYLACRHALSDRPAVLMRPEAPKNGSRVLFERFPRLWSRLNFSKKATIRNLFRYKKRLFMTIIGIGGCMGLMLVGFGIQDSIKGIAKMQYTEIFSQDLTVTVNDQATEQEIADLKEKVATYDGVTEYTDIALITVTLNANDTDRTAYLYVPEDPEKALDYVRLKDRTKDVYYSIPEDGALISEKTADMLGVTIGDTVDIKLTDDSEPVAVTISNIVENYVMHYLYITPETYKELFDEYPEYNEILVKYEQAGDVSYETKFGETLIASDACSSLEFVTDLEAKIDDMLDSLGMVMWVLILSSAFLAFVVLYNLNSINMTERKRELATLKVLGFHDREVAMYIYRENIILTVIGIIVGVFLGIILHRFIITTVEVDLMMFGRTIDLTSFVICALLTALFSIMVNLIMYWHFRKIDMIESLKSVE